MMVLIYVLEMECLHDDTLVYVLVMGCLDDVADCILVLECFH